MEKRGIKSLRPQKSPQQPYLIGREETIFSVNHCIVGGMLAEKWGFPARIFSVLECHHHPSFWDIESIPLDYAKDIATICISDLIVNYIQAKKNLLPEPEPEFFELIELRPPLENLVTTSLRQTIDNATEFLGTSK